MTMRISDIAMRRRVTERGISLIEILVVVIIVGILVSVGMPSYGEFIKSSSMLSTVNSVASKLREGARLSQALRKPVYVIANFNQGQIYITPDSPALTPYGEKVIANTGVKIRGTNQSAFHPEPPSGDQIIFRFTVHKTIDFITDAGDQVALHISRDGDAYTDANGPKFRTVTTSVNIANVQIVQKGCGAPFTASCN